MIVVPNISSNSQQESNLVYFLNYSFKNTLTVSSQSKITTFFQKCPDVQHHFSLKPDVIVLLEDSGAACWPRWVQYQETPGGFLLDLLTLSLSKNISLNLMRLTLSLSFHNWLCSGFQCNHTLCRSFVERAAARGANTGKLHSSNNRNFWPTSATNYSMRAHQSVLHNTKDLFVCPTCLVLQE